jgi:site-specific DNA-methyltransferase (adenine-specific)
MDMATVYRRNGVILYQEDCVRGMADLQAGGVEVIVTSPPYNLGIQYGTYDDTGPRAEYLTWTAEWAEGVYRVLSQEGSLFLNVGGKPSDAWVPFQVADCIRKQGFELQNTIHWIKSIAIEEAANGRNGKKPTVLCRGHYKPINSPRFLHDCHEYIFHFTKTGKVPLDRLAIGVPYQDKSNIGRWSAASEDLRCRGNTWFIPYDTIQSRDRQRPHPATFPPRLPEMCIRLHGRERVTTVLDPFMGIGNTAIAAIRLGLGVIGFEIDPQYFKVACDRLDEELDQVRQPGLPLTSE